MTKLKGKYRFYLEYPSEKDKRQGTRENLGYHDGNVIALLIQNKDGMLMHVWWVSSSGDICYEAITSIFKNSNSDVCLSAVGESYLRARCKRISQAQAEAIHPKLFEYLRYAEKMND